MDLLEFRPLIIGIIELIIAFYILRKGHYLKSILAIFVFFLAGYQIGEFIYFATDKNIIGLQIAYFSTTFLPAIGILLIEKIRGKNYGGFLLHIFGSILATTFLLDNTLIHSSGEEYCFVKISLWLNGNNTFANIWLFFYLATLTYGMILIVIKMIQEKDKIKDRILSLTLLTYLFFPTALLIVRLTNLDTSITASIMCALAFFSSITAAFVSTKFKNEK